jgi:hypothetical protein
MNFKDSERRRARRRNDRPGVLAALLGGLAVVVVFAILAALYAVG